jgi:hypothetical protein
MMGFQRSEMMEKEVQDPESESFLMRLPVEEVGLVLMSGENTRRLGKHCRLDQVTCLVDLA